MVIVSMAALRHTHIERLIETALFDVCTGQVQADVAGKTVIGPGVHAEHALLHPSRQIQACPLRRATGAPSDLDPCGVELADHARDAQVEVRQSLLCLWWEELQAEEGSVCFACIGKHL